jgi:hypothetical protein
MERFYGVPLTDLETIKKYARDPASYLSGGDEYMVFELDVL